MIPTEIDRLAAATNALRPDWPVQSLRTFITTNLAERSYRDATVALAWVATDPTSRTPKRVLEAGPWWLACRPADEPSAEPAQLGPSERCGTCYRSRAAHDRAESLVDPEQRHPWITEAEHRDQHRAARRPDETRNLDRTPLPDRSTRRTK